jgi:hypothetical protein
MQSFEKQSFFSEEYIVSIFRIEEGDCYPLQADFLSDNFFHAKDGVKMFLRNVCWLSTDYNAISPRRWNL